MFEGEGTDTLVVDATQHWFGSGFWYWRVSILSLYRALLAVMGTCAEIRDDGILDEWVLITPPPSQPSHFPLSTSPSLLLKLSQVGNLHTIYL